MGSTETELRRRLARLELATVASSGLLDRLQIGALVADSAGFVVHSNKTMQSLAARTDRPFIVFGADREQRIEARWFRAIVAPLFRPARERTTGAVVATVPSRSHGAALQMLLAPLVTGDVPKHTERPLGVMIFVSDPSDHIEPSLRTLQSLFKLTKTEARIAVLLAGGTPLREIAAALGITPGTARWHVKHLLPKTGTRSQRQLACVLLAGIAAVRAE